jgi:dephospho-CoA kinase
MKYSPLQIGITGGMGSGKTTVCKIFEALDIPVYYADDRAKWLMANDPDLKKKITERFGKEAYSDTGALNRAYLADRVFGDPESLQALNALVHPAVGRDSQRWQEMQQNVPYTIKEAALIFESGSFRQLDKVIVVFAPRELRIQRIMRRDGLARDAIEARMDRQMPEEEKIKKADFVIYNDGRASLIRQIWQIHHQLLQLAKEKDKL